MHLSIGKKIYLYIFIFVLLASLNNYKLNLLNNFKLKNIVLNNLGEFYNKELNIKILNLNNTNIFFLNKNLVKEIIYSNNLVDSFNVFKQYPSTLKIQLKKTEPIAYIILNGKKFIIGANEKLIDYYKIEDHVPLVFGNPTPKQLIELKNNITVSKLNYADIKNLFFYKSGRWDLEMNSGQIIRLPNENLINSLINIYFFLNNNDFDNIKTIDARVRNQINIYE